MTPLQTAAQALIDRWDSPLWKDQPHTAEYIAELRKALDDEITHSVEPDAWLRHDDFKAMTDDEKSSWIESGNADVVQEYTKPLYLHPPQPQATPPVPMDFETWAKGCEEEDGYEAMRCGYEAGVANTRPAVVPDGYVLVPIEPTDEMIDAGCDSSEAYRVDMVMTYKAMLAAQGEKP